jgi:hypothetical protein
VRVDLAVGEIESIGDSTNVGQARSPDASPQRRFQVDSAHVRPLMRPIRQFVQAGIRTRAERRVFVPGCEFELAFSQYLW